MAKTRMPSPGDPMASGSVPLPSADLINYRFDQTDKKFEEMFTKMDALGASYVTKEDAIAKRSEYDSHFRNHDDRLDHIESLADQQAGAIGLLRVIVTILTVTCAVVGALVAIRAHP